MFHNPFLALILPVICIAVQTQGSAECKKCMGNGVACKDSINYEICFNEVLSGITGTCENSYCSDAKEICVKYPHPTANFVCGSDTSSNGQCGICGTNDVYTCVDKTHFTLCANQQLYIQCPKNKMCSNDFYRQTKNSLCATEGVLRQFGSKATCSSDVTTVAPPTPSPLEAEKACASAEGFGRRTSFYMTNNLDDSGKTYLYCELVAGKWYSILYKCNPGQVFNSTEERCLTQSTTPVPTTAPTSTSTLKTTLVTTPGTTPETTQKTTSETTSDTTSKTTPGTTQETTRETTPETTSETSQATTTETTPGINQETTLDTSTAPTSH